MSISVDDLYLEVTRRCNLACGHCFRGDSEEVDMSIEVINNVLKDITSIGTLLLTGGEPLLAYEQLVEISRLIDENKIKVGRVTVITNGTILNKDIIRILKYFEDNFRLSLVLSEDKFHMMEIKRRGLFDKWNENYMLFSSTFNVTEYAQTSRVTVIQNAGRASFLTEDILEKINSSGDIRTNYVLGDCCLIDGVRNSYPKPYVYKNHISNVLYIDVNGNVAPVYYPYDEADSLLYASYDKDKSLVDVVKGIQKCKKKGGSNE